ncbi:LysR family transcriptional regulator [Streptomyces sp. DSM 41524]|uniref:LysR family transcriptional regulator n=1 Tax=Streptomyces asiaticus subsp. ignotus TaxID=3098222 RepID=A0ABU7PSA5_9ACTN|nr:LysR family transcriptional regulator [Streptomyces sp. DSM 41524]
MTDPWESGVRMSDDLGKIDLNILIALDALLAERSVTRAAERVFVGQPAMSASLARLRSHFGDPLLVRQGRGMTLTPLAESLVRPTQEALEAVQAVMGASKTFDPATGPPRTFTVIASDYAQTVLIRPILRKVEAESLNIRVNVFPAQADFIDQLRRGQCDLLIWPTSLAQNLSGFFSETLFTDEFVVAVDENHPGVGDTITVDELRRLPFLGINGPMTSIVESHFHRLGAGLRVAADVGGFAMAPHLVPGTRLVTVFQGLLADEAARSGLRTMPLPVPMATLTEAMYWHPHNNHDAAHRWFRHELLEVAAGLRL